jgi:uncharacterized membrane protein
MSHIEDVRVLDDQQSHWKTKGPLGSTIEWDAQIINEEQDRLIAWRSVEGSDVEHAGSVRFLQAGDQDTEVKVVLNYRPIGGKVGNAFAKLMGEDPEQQIQDDLQRFKRFMETGELPSTK